MPPKKKDEGTKDWSESLNELSQAVLKGGSLVISGQSLLTCHVYWINKTIACYFRNVPVSVLIPFWVWMSVITFGFFSLLRIKTCKMKTTEGKFHITKICTVDLIKLAGYNILTIELHWKYYWLIIRGPYYDLSILFHTLLGTENVMVPESIVYTIAQRSALHVWLELVKKVPSKLPVVSSRIVSWELGQHIPHFLKGYFQTIFIVLCFMQFHFQKNLHSEGKGNEEENSFDHTFVECKPGNHKGMLKIQY